MKATYYRLGVLLAVLCGSGMWALADRNIKETSSSPKKDSIEARRHARLRKLAESFTVYANETKEVRAKLGDEPIFRWANPQRDTIGGAIFMWTHQGRPQATIGLWTYDDTSATDSYELQSLAEHPFHTEQSLGGPPWPTRTPGLRFKPLPDRSIPGSSKPKRLVQMRQLARKHFSARLNPGTDRVEKLRLLPTPVYRYEDLPPSVMDGAMFSFAMGTDPEVFLLIEARNVKGKKSWHYAFANQTSERTDASLNSQVVWTNQDSKSSFRMVIKRPVSL